MPSTKTPAKASKQTSISSFFSKPSGGGPPSSPAVVPKKRAPSPPPKAKSAAAPKAAPKPKPKPAPKRKKQSAAVQDSNDDEEDEDGDVRLPVRSRRTKRALADDDDEDDEFRPLVGDDNNNDDDDGDDLYSVPAPAVKRVKIERASSPASVPVRKSVQAEQTTSRYRYDPSQKQKPEDMLVDEDPARKREKERLRERFVQKLGRIEISRKDVGGEGEEGEADDEEQQQEPEPGPITKRFGRGKAPAAAAKGKKGAAKLTPLEKQVVDIKRKHMDTVLVVEVGYKFRFFGEDARIASQNLSIMCIPGKMRFDEHPSEAHMDKFASASIPVHRLHVHVKRLVANGYKVGVVRQLETAALKAAGDNKAGPFERKLTNLYTKGTYVDDIDGLEGADLSSGAGSGGASNTGFLLCVTEKPGGGNGTDEKVHVGLVAVQPSTGEVIYDEFDDGFMRSEIETRLLHIAPCEFLIVGELSKSTEKIVSHLAGSTTTVFGDRVRVERMGKDKNTGTEASTHVSKFYADKVHVAESAEAAGKNKLLDAVLDLPGLVTICLSAMIKHLSDYGLEHVFDLTKYFQSFSGRSHMLLNGNTLSSLEIYRNQTDYTTKGSLFWTLDRTKTKFGRRLLRNWVGRPLLDKHQLEERVKAVEEAKLGENIKLDKLKELLAKVSYDLEKGLIRIYYGKCTRPELLSILQTMNRIASAFPLMENPEDVGFESDILNKAVAALPGIQEDVAKFLGMFNHQAAGKDDKYDFFKDEDEHEEYEKIVEQKMGIMAVEADLEEHKKDISKILKGKKFNYITVSGVEYLVEVPNTKVALAPVPANWVKISGTQKVHRFHTPQIIQMIRQRDQHKESLAAECDKAFKRFLEQISSKYQELRDCVQSLAILDCILSLAAVANQPGYSKPEFTSETIIDVKEGRHPMVEQLLLDAYVPNDITLCQNSKRAMLVTGPNMGGKSSYVRQIALISIMAQIGSYVPAASATLGLLDAVFTRMGAFDNMMAGESTFMVELSETSDILKQATPRSLIILDELGRGTSTHDGVAIAHAVFDYIVQDLKALLLFVTHYPLLSRFGEMYPDEVTNTHMAFEEAGEGGEDITFLYRVAEGVAHRSYGLNVARLAGLPKSCLELAAVKSRQLEAEMKERAGVRWATSVRKIMEDDEVDVEALARSLEGVVVDV